MTRKAGMSDDMAAFGFSALPAGARETPDAAIRAAYLPKIGIEGLENPGFASYLRRASLALWPRLAVAEARDGEDLPAPAPPREPGHGTAERTRRDAGPARPVGRPAGIGDTGDADGDQA
jgi:hypothetical protein